MGGAEGTKLNLDFMDMERVSKHAYCNISHCSYSLPDTISV